MAEQNKENNLKNVLEVVEVKATANAEAHNKTAIWADRAEIKSSNILDKMMGNFEVWNSSFRNELINRECGICVNTTKRIRFQWWLTKMWQCF